VTEASSSGDRLPGPGELVLFPETASLPVEWVVLGRDPSRPGRVLVVPADSHPKAGTADLEVPASSPVAPLTLRCGFEVWLDESRLGRATRTGDVVDPEEVAAARRIQEARERGEAVGSLLAEEVDADPDYQDWIEEVLAPSRVALTAPAQAPAVPTQRRALLRAHPLGLAASILLTTTLGLAGGVLWQGRRIAVMAQEKARRAGELQRERERFTSELQRAEDLHRRELSETGRAAEEHRKQDQERIAALERRLGDLVRPEALLNVPLQVLSSGDPVRGDIDELILPAKTRLFFLLLSISDPRSFPSYRLEVVDGDSGQVVWKAEGLKSSSDNEVSLVVRRGDFAPGEYRFRLFGLKGGNAELVEEYQLRVVHQ
jgi:hypothetical protein